MKNFLLLIAFIFLQNLTAQNIVFEGKIIDETTKETIPFTNIYIQNTTQGVISNEEGVFKFFIPSNFETVEISHIGYKTKMIAINEIVPEFKFSRLYLCQVFDGFCQIRNDRKICQVIKIIVSNNS